MAPAVRSTRTGAARWRDRFAAADPGGFARRGALRAVVSVSGSAVLLGVTASRLGLPFTVVLIGAALAMVSSIAIGDPEPAAQRWSLLAGLAAAAAAVALGTVAASSELLAGAVLCAIVFAGVLARAIGPRGLAVGMMAFMGYFFALFARVPPARLPAVIGAVAVGGAVAYAARFWIVRERPERVRAEVLRAFRARVQLLLDDLARDAAAGADSPRRWRRIRRATGGVDEVALALEEAVGGAGADSLPPRVREWLAALLHAEVAVSMLAYGVHEAAVEAPPERRRALAAMVRALQAWIADGSDAARAEALRLLREARAEAAAEAAREEEYGAWWRIERAVATLTTARPWAAFPEADAGASRVSVQSFRPGGGGITGLPGMSPNLRLAIQAALAVGLAMVVGRAISPVRWYWAVLAAFVVFARASTVGETLSRAWQRVLGTIVGVAAGLLVARLVGHDVPLAILLGLVALFVAYYLLSIYYAGMIAAITAALALLYEEMGAPVPGLMELRLLETAAGAVIGVVVAAVVFPVHSRERVRALVAAVLREAAGTIERATTPGIDPRVDPGLQEQIRRVDRALAELRNALRPLLGPNLPIEPPVVTRQGRMAAALAYATRLFVTTCPITDPEEARVVQLVGRRLARNCRAVADAFESGTEPPLLPVAPLIADLRRTGLDREGRIGPRAALLLDVDAIVRRLARLAPDARIARARMREARRRGFGGGAVEARG